MDDANVPSLLSLPLLDPDRLLIDEALYASTRAFLLSKHHPYYYCDKHGGNCGIGSPHTPEGFVWPMSLIVQLATSSDQHERQRCLAQLLASSTPIGDRHKNMGWSAPLKELAARGVDLDEPMLHESFDPSAPTDAYTRNFFAWVAGLFSRYACEPCYASARK